jgi:hypothetical protein
VVRGRDEESEFRGWWDHHDEPSRDDNDDQTKWWRDDHDDQTKRWWRDDHNDEPRCGNDHHDDSEWWRSWVLVASARPGTGRHLYVKDAAKHDVRGHGRHF